MWFLFFLFSSPSYTPYPSPQRHPLNVFNVVSLQSIVHMFIYICVDPWKYIELILCALFYTDFILWYKKGTFQWKTALSLAHSSLCSLILILRELLYNSVNCRHANSIPSSFPCSGRKNKQKLACLLMQFITTILYSMYIYASWLLFLISSNICLVHSFRMR